MLGIAEPLTRVGFEVLVPDISAATAALRLVRPSPISLELVRDVIDIAEHRDAREVTVIGHSLGAFVALADSSRASRTTAFSWCRCGYRDVHVAPQSIAEAGCPALQFWRRRAAGREGDDRTVVHPNMVPT